jgi:hypothetical protein
MVNNNDSPSYIIRLKITKSLSYFNLQLLLNTSTSFVYLQTFPQRNILDSFPETSDTREQLFFELSCTCSKRFGPIQAWWVVTINHLHFPDYTHFYVFIRVISLMTDKLVPIPFKIKMCKNIILESNRKCTNGLFLKKFWNGDTEYSAFLVCLCYIYIHINCLHIIFFVGTDQKNIFKNLTTIYMIDWCLMPFLSVFQLTISTIYMQLTLSHNK